MIERNRIGVIASVFLLAAAGGCKSSGSTTAPGGGSGGGIATGGTSGGGVGGVATGGTSGAGVGGVAMGGSSGTGGIGGAPVCAPGSYPPACIYSGVGENNVATFAINATTGEPTLLDTQDSHGFEPRTATLDADASVFIVANQKFLGTTTGTVPPNLAVFKVGTDGKLTFDKTYDLADPTMPGAANEAWWVGAIKTPAPSAASIVYASVGEIMWRFGLDAAGGLTKMTGTTDTNQIVQFADFDSMRKFAYVSATTTTNNFLYAYGVDPATGGLTLLNMITPSNMRSINIQVAPMDNYLLAVGNVTRKYTVVALGADGKLGAEVPQATADGGTADGGTALDLGAFVHQIRVDPTGKYVVICDRGNDPGEVMAGSPEDLGHIHLFTFDQGVLTHKQTIVMPPGIGPRHSAWHPTKPWLYVSTERGNKLLAFSLANDMLTQGFMLSTLKDVTDSEGNQRAGAIIMHPSGNFLYVTNRNITTMAATP
jgi:6-phosphogluconolactonase (cycloisomerase 2 family)